MKRLALLSTLCIAGLTVPALPARAASVTLVPAAGPAGSTATITGGGFPRGTRAVVRAGASRRSARVDRSGRFTASLAIPAKGRRALKVTSTARARRVVNVFRVRAAGPAPGEVASSNGARIRWSPLKAEPGDSLALALRGFPPRRTVFVRVGAASAKAGTTGRRGKAAIRARLRSVAPGRTRVIVRAGRIVLRFSVFVEGAGGNTPQAPPILAGLLRPAIEGVTSATAYRYGAHDDQASTLDTLKVIPSPGGGYLGVYHTLTGGVFVTKLARSSDLLQWTHVVDLEPHASQPTITALSDGGFLVSYEKDAGCSGTGPGGNCLGFRHYAGLSQLLAGAGDRTFQAPRTLSNCAEGTPNTYSADLRPDIDHSTIDIGFHYFRNCDVDRQARGSLENFSSWSAHVEGGLNSALEDFHPGGNIGDRDFIKVAGGSYNIHEVQFTKGAFGSWRVYLFDWLTGVASPLAITTHRGSTAFANPTFTSLISPAGRPALLVTLFIPSQGAAPGESGELIYYRELP